MANTSRKLRANTCAMMAAKCLQSAERSPDKRPQLMRRAKVWLMLAQDKRKDDKRKEAS